jgi:hypothetical protein
MKNEWVWVWVILRPTVSRPVCLGIKPPSGAYDQICITVRQLRVCWYGAPSLTRGRVCRLQLLLSSPAQSFSGPSPAGLKAIFYCLRFETPPTWRTRSMYLYPPGTGWPGYTPRHWVSPSLCISGKNRIHITTSNISCSILMSIRCCGNCVNFVATLWFSHAYSLLRQSA